MKKYSRQREVILKSLKNRMDHPTAEILYQDVKQQLPAIGIATIYRNLSELCQEGKITKIKSSLGKERYDGNLHPHIHLECSQCGKMEDIFLKGEDQENLDNEIKKFADQIQAEVLGSSIILSGICKACRN